jgi:4-hydroxyphenylacetate 3-monooxygenase
MNGAEFIESIQDDREIYIYGERVKDVTEHPAFRTPIRSMARLYDALHDGSMKVVPTDTGNGGYTHPYFKMARSAEDMLDAKEAMTHWARLTYGWMGRTPDYKAAFLGTLAVNDEFYGEYRPNAQRWYKESQEKVLYWNHALINPPIDRHLPPDEVGDVFLHVVKETDSGVVVSGAKVVATGSAMTNMAFLGYAGAPVKDKKFAIVAGVEMSTPGVKLISRTSYAQTAEQTASPFDYPLSSRFDENDAILILDNVEIPWENIFLYGDVEQFNQFGPKSGFAARLTFQGATRLAVKIDFIAGLLIKSLEMTGAGAFRGVEARLGEVLSWRSTYWAIVDEMARNPEPWLNGSVQPNPDAVNSYRWLSMVGYARIREIVLQDLGSALIYLPSSVKDFKSPAIRPYLDKYVRGSGGIPAEERVKTLKMLWDAVGTEFGGRHELYERNYQGSHEQVRLLVAWDHAGRGTSKQLTDFAEQAMSEYDLDGWTLPGLQ